MKSRTRSKSVSRPLRVHAPAGKSSVCPSIERRPGSIEATLRVIGDKWTALLVGQMVGEARTFGELEDCLPGMSPRTLSQRLAKLLKAEIIAKALYSKKPERYRYTLTKKGLELRDILIEMAEWGEKYR